MLIPASQPAMTPVLILTRFMHHQNSINRAAKDLRALVESASRGLSIETFAKFENDLFQVRALANLLFIYNLSFSTD